MVNIMKNGQTSITRGFMLGLMLMSVVVTGLQSQPVQADDDGKDYVPTVLITGANRGIGFEFVKQYTAKGWKVIATCRTPDKEANLAAFAAENDNVVIEQIDVTRNDMIDKVAKKYEEQPIDVLINNAGHTMTNDMFMQQIFGQLNYELAEEYFRTNSLGPLKMAEAFADSVAKSRHKKIVSISSLLGSVTLRSGPGMYFYSMSKAALNIGQSQVAKDTKSEGLIVALLSPGLVDKKETKDADDKLVKGGRVPIKLSIAGMIKVIDKLTPERSGSFTRWDGENLTW